MQTLDEQRTCKICLQDFCMINSLGRLQCTEHASSFISKDPKTGKYFWPCCMRECDYATPHAFYASRPGKLYSGCIRADHNSESVPYSSRTKSDFTNTRYVEGYPSIKLPHKIVKSLPGVVKEVIEDLGNGEVEVFMYDYKAKRELLKNRNNEIKPL